METTRKKFKIWTHFFRLGLIFLLMQHPLAAWLVSGGVFGEGIKKELCFSAFRDKESQFSFIIAQHGQIGRAHV